MAVLKHKEKTILKEAAILEDFFSLAVGLMFASEKKVKKGVIMKVPWYLGSQTKLTITMLFVRYPLDILFLDKELKVVDKTTLEPGRFRYKPKKEARYVIETLKGTFSRIKTGDKVEMIEK